MRGFVRGIPLQQRRSLLATARLCHPSRPLGGTTHWLQRESSMCKPEARPELLLTPVRAAQSLSISPRTLWTLTKSGQIPCVRIGRLVRYDPQDLQRWIDQRKER